jgi:hypothetical protein
MIPPRLNLGDYFKFSIEQGELGVNQKFPRKASLLPTVGDFLNPQIVELPPKREHFLEYGTNNLLNDFGQALPEGPASCLTKNKPIERFETTEGSTLSQLFTLVVISGISLIVAMDSPH